MDVDSPMSYGSSTCSNIKVHKKSCCRRFACVTLYIPLWDQESLKRYPSGDFIRLATSVSRDRFCQTRSSIQVEEVILIVPGIVPTSGAIVS